MDQNIFPENEAPVNEDLRAEHIRKPSIMQVGIVYSISVILLFILGSKAQQREFYSGALITEFVLVLAPALIMLLIFKYDIRKVLRLNRISFMNIFLVFWIMIFAIPVVTVLNLANYWLIKYIFGKVVIEQPPIATDAKGLIISLLIIAGSAGICEEVLFRGVILRGLERFGAVKAILFTALLFGLMHVDFQKLLGTFLLGALIGFMVYRTDSLFAGMFAHFTNNATAVVIVYASTKLADMVKSPGVQNSIKSGSDIDFSSLINMPKAQLIAAIIVYGFVIAFCVAVFIGLLKAFIKNTSKESASIAREAGGYKAAQMLWMLPGLAVVGFLYFVEGLRLKGITIHAVENVLKFLGVK